MSNSILPFDDTPKYGDRGSYLLLLYLKRQRNITIGGLGTVKFTNGYYIYVGSAMRNLSARIARHLRKRKRLYWHIDYLLQVADSVTPLPIRSSEKMECRIAEALASLLPPGPEGFGSSDCNCPTHLFRSKKNPLRSISFHNLLQRFRMRHPA
ncbi:MAG: GIY-YIG nuclease family protein [Planctomycetota bacterium]